MIYLVTVWYKITQYDDTCVISIAKLVETTWLAIYLRPTENKYDQGSDFIVNDFRGSLIKA